MNKNNQAPNTYFHFHFHYQETVSDEMSVVNAHLNELPVIISVCAKTNFLRCIGNISFTKDRYIKLDLLQMLNYQLSVLLLSNLMPYDIVRQCMKRLKPEIKIGFGQ